MSQEPDISTVSVLKRERVRFTAFFTSLSVKQDKRETVCPPPLLHCALLQQLCNGLESQSHWREQATHFSSVKKKKKKRLPIRTQILSFLDVIITRLPEKLSG